MKKHINLMQNPHDIIFDQNSEYSTEYLVQALANLGQRIGIKGDGIAYKSFNFNDILLDSDTYPADKYIGYIEYIKNDFNNQIKALFGVTSKTNLEVDNKVIDTSININNTLTFNSELSFSIPVCEIEKYSKNSICINNNNELTFMLIGKKLGYDDKDDNNSVLMYYKFNVLTNKLICCYKLFHFLNNGTDNYYCLLNVNNESYNEYSLNINIFNSSNFTANENNEYGSIYKEKFEQLFKFSSYFDNSPIPFTILNPNYENTDELLLYDEYNLDFNSAISLVLNMANVYHSGKITLLFDTYKNELLSESEAFENLKEFYYKEYQLNLNEVIFDINEDINKLYINIFNYYNNKFYLEKRATLIKRILSKLYEKSIDYKTIFGKRLYIPLDYEFHYICNSNNELNIYYSNNIYVTYTSLANVDLSEFWKSNNNLVFDYDDLNKLKVYNFEINYNTYIENLINSISIKDVYTMPYINAANNWCINDSDTKIKAIGKDAGNPNIIVIYNNDTNNQSNSYNVLNVISNKEKVLNSNYNQRWFKVNNLLFNNVDAATDIECCAYIPEVTNINYDYFKDSIILSISDLNCLKYEGYKELYKGSYILTLWRLIDDNEELKFECINQLDSDYSLALGSTINQLNELSDSSIANLNSQDLILLKSIISNVAHERLDVNMNNWAIIKNKQSEEYDSNNNEYNNDLNMIVQYDDQISLKSNHVIHSHSNSKYISDINNVSITNSLYQKYKRSEEVVKETDSISVIVNKLQNVSSRESTIIVNGNRIDNIEALIERLKVDQYAETVTEETLKNIVINKLEKINSNYYEYVFNNNVPTLDYKEIFIRNFNLLNRLNIISLDNNGGLYNAYIGTSYDEINKSTLHIGTSNLNINLGSDTLINEIDKDKFKTHQTLAFDFENINLNASKNINLSKEITYVNTINNINYIFTSMKLFDIIDTNATSNSLYNSSLFYINLNNEVLSNDPNYYLCINKLMNKLGKDITEYNGVNIHTNISEFDSLTTIRSNGKDFKFIKLNDGNSNKYIKYDIIREDNLNILYCYNTLEIMYYESSSINSNNQRINKINIYLSFK